MSSLRGDTEPRIFTPPLRELTPETSYGFAVIDFAERVLGKPLDAWQQWLVVHAGELLPDGTPRFRQVLLIVARQNGKSHLLRVLALFWIFVQRLPLVYGIANTLAMAKESWTAACLDAETVPALKRRLQTVRNANGQEAIVTAYGTRYLIGASGRNAGRGFTISRLFWDEVRQERSWDTHAAVMPALGAVPGAQAWLVTNQGDDASEVLNATREAAVAGTDPTLFIAEWSAPPGSDPSDPRAWAAANPNLGVRVQVADMASAAAQAVAAGGELLGRYLTERLCIRIMSLNVCVDPRAWRNGAADGSLDAVRARVALCLDVAPDGLHATLCAAAAVRPGIVRVEVVAAWSGIGATDKLRADLPGWVARVKPRVLGWLPGGPAASLAADLGKARPAGWPPRDVVVQEIAGASVAQVCMGLAEQVVAGAVEHPEDPLLDAHVLEAEKLVTGDTWRFSRKGKGHVDAAYAAAGAVFLARTLPARKSGALPKSLAQREQSTQT